MQLIKKITLSVLLTSVSTFSFAEENQLISEDIDAYPPHIIKSKPKELPKEEKPKTVVVVKADTHKTPLLLQSDRPVDAVPLVANYIAAKMAESEGDFESAAYFYLQAEAADPDNYQLKEKAFSYALATGAVGDAIRISYSLGEFDDAMPLVYLMRVVDAVYENEYDKAEDFVTKAQAPTPRLLQFHLMLAYLDIARGESLDAVVTRLLDVDVHKSLKSVLHYHLGRMYESAGRMSEAVNSYVHAYELDTTSAFPVMGLGRAYEHTGQTDKAAKLYQEYVTSNPESLILDTVIRRFNAGQRAPEFNPTVQENIADVLFGFATLMSSQGSLSAAHQMMNFTSYLDENYPFVEFYMGIMSEQLGKPNLAITHYESVSKDSPVWAAAQVRLGESYFASGQVDKAIDMMEKLLKKRDDLPVVRHSLAEMYYDTGAYDKAIKQYDVILASTPQVNEKNEARLYFARGASHERLRNYDKASFDIEKSLTLDPDNAMALNYLGYMWIDAQDGANMDKAFKYIRRALVLRPNDGSILDSMGWAWYKKGDYEKAVTYLERAIELKPEDATVNDHLGDVYEKLGRSREARKQWNRALSLGPDSPEAEVQIKSKLGIISTSDLK